MAESKQGRGSIVPLDPVWLARLNVLWEQVKAGNHPRVSAPIGIKTFGKMLAVEVGRDRPFSDASISRFLSGAQTSDDILQAMVAFFRLPYPVLSARSEEEVEWFAIGRKLLTLGSEGRDRFLKVRALALSHIDVVEKELELSQELESNPEDVLPVRRR